MAVLAIVVKAFLDWLLGVVFPLGIGGIALSTTIMTVFNLSHFYPFLLRKKIGNLGATKTAQAWDYYDRGLGPMWSLRPGQLRSCVTDQ